MRGEETVHPDDLEAQSAETFLNLATLVEVGRNRSESGSEPSDEALCERLAAFRHLRVYYVDPEEQPAIAARIGERFRDLETVEYLRTELCRSDLLIEIEGVAELD